ncbi:hypothetical protein ACX0G9_03235 [Flavitalea flava]
MTDLAGRQERTLSNEQPIYAINTWLVFSGICFIYLFYNWYLQSQVLTDEVYYNSLGGRVGAEKLSAFLSFQHSMGFLSYLMVPMILLVKMTLVSFCLLTGLLLTSRKLPFNVIFKIVVFAEAAFAASTLLKLLLLAFSTQVESLAQFQAFAPLSVFSLVKAWAVPDWLIMPLQTFDLFLVIYCLFLAAGLRFFLGKTLRDNLVLVLGSYGLGLFCWLVVLVFVTISFNPHT